MHQTAILFYAKALYRQSEPLKRRALAIGEAFFGKDHPEVATDLNNLAQLLQATNRLAEAEPLMRRALAIDEAISGKDPLGNVAIRLGNLAELLKATNRLAEAEPLMRRALAIDEASFGDNHPKVAIRLGNLRAIAARRQPPGRGRAIDGPSRSPSTKQATARTIPTWRETSAISRSCSPGHQPPRRGRALQVRRALAIFEASLRRGNRILTSRSSSTNLAQLLQATNQPGGRPSP